MECLVTGIENTAHTSRMKLYTDQDLNVTVDLKEQIMHDGWRFHVEKILQLREKQNRIELLVKWLGLSEAENSWEPVETMLEGVPTLTKKCLGNLPTQ